MPPVKQYWGRAEIMERLGYSRGSADNFTDIVRRDCIPVWIRRKPGTLHRMYYTDELAIQRWQVAMASRQRRHIVECNRERLDRRYKALDRKRKASGT